MTKVNKIVMHGFKSFAKRTEVVFDDAFNCVIGPNGSGKSNLLDAICFVLGKSSAKGLRAEKSANLVYNGGKSKKPAKEGKVSIYFDNSKKTFPTDEKVVKITRIVKGDGSSKYKINDQIRTRTQILDTLAIAKINPDGYNIVLQGIIGKFVELSPMEKRKMIEEIAGISMFDEKRDKAQRELDKVQEKLSEAEIVLKERKNYLNDLKKERDQALKYKDLNDKIRQNKASFLKINIDKYEKERSDIEQKSSKQQEILDKHQKKIEKYRKDIEETRKKIKEISQTVEEKGDKDQVKMQKEIEELRINIATNKTRITSHENELQRIAERKQQMSQNIEDIKYKIKDYDDKEETLGARMKRRTSEKKEIDSKITAFKKKHKLDKDTDDIDQKIDTIDVDSEKLQLEIQELREKQQELMRKQDRADMEIRHIDEQIEKVKEIEKQNKMEIDDLKNKRNEFKKTTLELNKKLDMSSMFAAKLGKDESTLHTLRSELSKLQARDASMKERASGNIAVQKILEKKREIPGIYGTVGELGEVSSKYSLALEMAAGPRIRGVVVKDDSVAAQCIRYLKTHKLGSATFLPLNKLKSPDTDAGKFSKANGSHGRAVDLIKYDPKYKKAFEYVFGNTIVVDNIDVARRIGIGNIRMATISGDLAESSGAMQGGYRTHQKTGSAFKEKELSSTIEDHEARVADLENNILKIRKEKQDTEEEIVKLREFKANLEGEIIKVEKGLHLKSDDLDANKNYKEDLIKSKKEIDRDIGSLTSEVSQKNKNLAKLKIERQSLKDKLSQLRNPRLLAELNTFEQRRQELTEDIFKIESELKGLKTQKEEIFGRDQENSLKVIKDIEKEEIKFKDEIQVFEKENKQKTKELKDKELALDKFYKKYKSLFNQRTKLNDEIVVIERSINVEEDNSRKVEYKINALSLERTKIDTHLSTLREDFAQYEGVTLDLKKPIGDLKKEISDFEKMKEKIGSVNLRALEIYDNVENEYNRLMEKKGKLQSEKDDVVTLIQEIEGRKKDLFMQTFDKVKENFISIFQQLSSKGEAYIELENRDDPFDGGMLVRVKLSGSKFMDLRSLSGGEKTLTALAFIFAIQEYEPATFYVLDEVDAALDKRNAEKLSKLINKYSASAQYVMISHNDAVITEASTLYGVSMDENGISKIVSLKV